MEEKKIESPYVEPVSFDYNKLRSETTFPAIKEIYKVLAESADLLVYDKNSTEESITKDVGSVSQKVLEVLIRNNVANCDMQYVINIIQDSISGVFTILSRQKGELEKEYLARTIGARDPGTKKYSREYATLADMFHALEKKRNEQDTEENQYFIVKKAQ